MHFIFWITGIYSLYVNWQSISFYFKKWIKIFLEFKISKPFNILQINLCTLVLKQVNLWFCQHVFLFVTWSRFVGSCLQNWCYFICLINRRSVYWVDRLPPTAGPHGTTEISMYSCMLPGILLLLSNRYIICKILLNILNMYT